MMQPMEVGGSPGADTNAAVETVESNSSSAGAGLPLENKVKILLIDDQPGNLLALEAILESLGQELVKARSGREALRCLLEDDFAVLLLDVRMPDMDGLETAELIRERRRSRHTPIIFLTAYEPSEVQMFKGYSLGAVDYMHKPIVPEILRSKVAVFVQLARVTEQAKRQSQLLREIEHKEHERQLAEQRQYWEMEKLRAEAAKEKQLSEELAEAARRKDEFLAMLGHELRNPLAPILNVLHVLRLGTGDPTSTASMQEIVERQVQHMSRLVDDLLDVARINQGKIQLRKENVKLPEIIARAVDSTKSMMTARRHQLEVILPAMPVWLEGDPTRLEQILANLLNNAAKYTEPGGRIWLTVALEGNEASIRVRDSGIGMTPEMLHQVFELFMQANHSLDRSEGGLGIGLTLVRRLVELHGGSITAHSAGLGFGSEIEVRLPALRGAVQSRATLSQEMTKRVGRPTRVLVVDDNRDAADSLALLLRLEGHAVEVAYDGEAALAAVGQHHPLVVLLDIGLPKMDGYEVARRLRETDSQRQLFLVAMTGYGQDEHRRRCHDAGFDMHMVKPVDHAILTEMLASTNFQEPSETG